MIDYNDINAVNMGILRTLFCFSGSDPIHDAPVATILPPTPRSPRPIGPDRPHMFTYYGENEQQLGKILAAKTRSNYTQRFNDLHAYCEKLIDMLNTSVYDGDKRNKLKHYTALLSQYKATFFDSSRHDPFDIYDELCKMSTKLQLMFQTD